MRQAKIGKDVAEQYAEQIIDAHHHLWRYSSDQYPWIAENMITLHRDYLLDDLKRVAHPLSVIGTVTVQARQSMEESKWLSHIAATSDLIRGVVGWVPLIDKAVSSALEALASLPKMKAVRHVLHDEPDHFYMLRPDFNRGVSYLKDLGLAYDLLVFERHLPQTIEFVDRHPGQRFILDHFGKPKVHAREVSPWRENLCELARRANVYCKISGLVTEGEWDSWTYADLRIYFDVVLEAFGPKRIMFGSDWPVVTLASSYARWLHSVKRAIRSLSSEEQSRVLCGTAIEAYRL